MAAINFELNDHRLLFVAFLSKDFRTIRPLSLETTTGIIIVPPVRYSAPGPERHKERLILGTADRREIVREKPTLVDAAERNCGSGIVARIPLIYSAKMLVKDGCVCSAIYSSERRTCSRDRNGIVPHAASSSKSSISLLLRGARSFNMSRSASLFSIWITSRRGAHPRPRMSRNTEGKIASAIDAARSGGTALPI